MNIGCDIIRDLLPLYAEDMVSQATKELVGEHLNACPACAGELEKLQAETKIPVEVEPHALKLVKNTIRRKRVLAVLTAVLTVCTLFLGWSLLMDARIYLTAEQAVAAVEAGEDGSVCIRWTELVTGGAGSGEMQENTVWVVAWSRLGKLLRAPEGNGDAGFAGVMTLEDVAQKRLWYTNPRTWVPETGLWNTEGAEPPEGVWNTNYHLAYYCGVLAALAAVLGLLGWRLVGKWYGEFSTRLAILLGSVSLSTVVACAGQFVEVYGEFTQCVGNGLTLAVPMMLAALFGRQLYRLNRQEKNVSL